MDYRNIVINAIDDDIVKRGIFIDDMCDNGIFNMVVGNDNNRGDGGRPSNDECIRRMNGCELRDKLKQALLNHNIVII